MLNLKIAIEHPWSSIELGKGYFTFVGGAPKVTVQGGSKLMDILVKAPSWEALSVKIANLYKEIERKYDMGGMTEIEMLKNYNLEQYSTKAYYEKGEVYITVILPTSDRDES